MWWLEIDREEVERTTRDLIPSGCLALVGDVEAGTSEAIRISGRLLARLNYRCLDFVALGGRATTPRTVLLSFLDQLSPSGPGVTVSRTTLVSGGSMAGIIDLIADAIDESSDKIALMADGIDRDAPLPPDFLSAYATLADQASCPVIVTGSPLSSWASVSDITRLDLRDFTFEDVLDAMRNAPKLSELGTPDLRLTARLLARPDGHGLVRPMSIYTRLTAWTATL